MDFGIAKSALDPGQTRPGTTMGSMLYMSPEQVNGATVDQRSNIYSFGVLLYEISTGRRPFEGETDFALLDAHLNTPPRPPIELNPSLPPALNEIILTALNKDPMRRFQTAEAFRKALESLQSRPAPPPLPQTQPQPAGALPPPAKSTRGLWMAIGALACVAVLIGGAVALPHFWKSAAATAKPDAVVSTPVSVQTPVVQEPPTTTTPPPITTTMEPPPSSTPACSAPHKGFSRVEQTKQPPPASGAAEPTTTPVVTPPPPAQTAVAPPSGPTQEQIDEAGEELMKVKSRAESIRGSLDHLRSQQAADGLSINPTVASGASRMDGYLQAAERALQNNNLEAARKNTERADAEVTKLEAFFGR